MLGQGFVQGAVVGLAVALLPLILLQHTMTSLTGTPPSKHFYLLPVYPQGTTQSFSRGLSDIRSTLVTNI